MLLDNKELQVLKEFGGNCANRIYGRKVANKLSLNQKTVSNILNSLEQRGIIKFKREGKNKIYFFNKANGLWKEVAKLIEIEKKSGFLERHRAKQDLFFRLEERTNGALIIFGSYASESETTSSDLDILITKDMGDFQDLEKLYGIKINPIKIKRNFSKEDPLIKEVVENHIILKGLEEFAQWI